MGLLGVVFALFAAGYILGMWTTLALLKQPQKALKEAFLAPRRP
jgi:hypothetical protein